MKSLNRPFPVLVVIVSVLLACGLGEKKKELEALAQTLEDASAEIEEKLSGLDEAALDSLGPAAALEKLGEIFGPGEGFEPLEYETLKKQFPKRLGGLDFVESDGESTTMGSTSINVATARYSNTDGTQTLRASVSDLGAVSGVLNIVAAWANTNFENKGDKGFERAGKLDDGHPMHEEFNYTTGKIGNGKKEILLGKRVVVSVEGRNMNWKDIDDAAIDLSKRTARIVPKPVES